ncbi:hypothetical protein [Zunongwangia atlantica]|uniref:Restriction endonuclease n=1 Tax=Zunongwangia atlantica 22II14-10F7 TaxID=1185767 RepID=A0A1Y1T022_9FLAO|nr:hypothetical protein [Zunongwangia atlantica]ORL43955.1 hypothetical protein IIF7_18352 [Zunongwangia atlantica 22II14-10F7]
MNYRQEYLKALEKDCIELVVNAYNTAITDKKYKIDWLENDFSELLGYYVNESPLSLKKRITCKTENKLLSELENKKKGFADKLPRIDFVYFKIWKENRFHCYMEAKRLKQKNSNLKRSYINEGMQRYISKKYPIGCMLGYLLEGQSSETIKGINIMLKKDKRETEILNHKQNKLLENYYESNHSEIGIMKHLIFDFTEF